MSSHRLVEKPELRVLPVLGVLLLSQACPACLSCQLQCLSQQRAAWHFEKRLCSSLRTSRAQLIPVQKPRLGPGTGGGGSGQQYPRTLPPRERQAGQEGHLQRPAELAGPHLRKAPQQQSRILPFSTTSLASRVRLAEPLQMGSHLGCVPHFPHL